MAMDMKPHIEAAHAVIHPSYYEGMTNVVLEHSAMGRPCIGSNIPGVREERPGGCPGSAQTDEFRFSADIGTESFREDRPDR